MHRWPFAEVRHVLRMCVWTPGRPYIKGKYLRWAIKTSSGFSISHERHYCEQENCHIPSDVKVKLHFSFVAASQRNRIRLRYGTGDRQQKPIGLIVPPPHVRRFDQQPGQVSVSCRLWRALSPSPGTCSAERGPVHLNHSG